MVSCSEVGIGCRISGEYSPLTEEYSLLVRYWAMHVDLGFSQTTTCLIPSEEIQQDVKQEGPLLQRRGTLLCQGPLSRQILRNLPQHHRIHTSLPDDP